MKALLISNSVEFEPPILVGKLFHDLDKTFQGD